jgi:transposase InsO family protein
MSKVETPTDNPIIESLNGLTKQEMRIDFDFKFIDNIPSFIEKYVRYFNNQRLSYKLGYKTPVQYKNEQGFN